MDEYFYHYELKPTVKKYIEESIPKPVCIAICFFTPNLSFASGYQLSLRLRTASLVHASSPNTLRQRLS